MVEQQLDFSKYVPDGFGTGDCIIVADEILTVIDYKHGKGVAVSAENNSQIMLYALGAMELFDSLYDISEVKTVIFQPRIGNISEHTITAKELLDWAENKLRPTAELAAKGEGEFCAGEHCRFCKIKATCRKRAEYNLMLAQYDFAPSATLEDNEIEAVLEKADALAAWANDVKVNGRKQENNIHLNAGVNMPSVRHFPANSGQATKWLKEDPHGSTPMKKQLQKQSKHMAKIHTVNRRFSASRL